MAAVPRTLLWPATLGALLLGCLRPAAGEATSPVGAETAREGVGKRCGGGDWNGSTTCPAGLACNHTNEFWWDCQRESPAEDRAHSVVQHPSEAPLQEGLAPALPSALALGPQAPAQVAARINERFLHGSGQEDLAGAGVLVHQFHNGGDGDWRPWMPCPATCNGGPCWCAKFSDRFSTTIINARTVSAKGQVSMYSNSNAGFVLSPWAMKVSCAYPADGGSEGKSCKEGETHCVPGCGEKWCHFDPTMPNNMDTSCAWAPSELARVLTLQENAKSSYNEVVVDAGHWVDNLPGSIEAIFFVKGTKGEAEARQVHADFLNDFAEKSIAARNVPVLQFDPKNQKAPFAAVTSHTLQLEFQATGPVASSGASSRVTAALLLSVAGAGLVLVMGSSRRLGALGSRSAYPSSLSGLSMRRRCFEAMPEESSEPDEGAALERGGQNKDAASSQQVSTPLLYFQVQRSNELLDSCKL